MEQYRPPQAIPDHAPRPWIFLAGAIDQGRAEPWQNAVVPALIDQPGTLCNPRRVDWDASWRQTLDDPRFAGQVKWELDALEDADLILCWLPAGSQAPVSLLELGLHARGGRLIVGCDDGFHRQGNVAAVCARFGIPLVGSLSELIEGARQQVEKTVALAGAR